MYIVKSGEYRARRDNITSGLYTHIIADEAFFRSFMVFHVCSVLDGCLWISIGVRYDSPESLIKANDPGGHSGHHNTMGKYAN